MTSRRRSTIAAELRPEKITAVVDSREQCPLDLTPLQTVTGTLTTGDYSIRGLEHVVAIERKSLGDLLSCVGRERERFDREIRRLLGYPVRAVIVEASWDDLERGEWRGDLSPEQVIGSVLGWNAAGVPVLPVGDRQRASRYVTRLLVTAAKRRWREARLLVQTVTDDEGAAESVEAGQPPEPFTQGDAA